MQRVLILLIMLVLPALAQPPLSTQPRFELQLAPAGVSPAPVGRDVDKCVDFFLELYKRSGPRLGCRFIESTYLLTLADFRGRGAWNGFLAPTGPEDLAKIDELNRWLVPQGLSLHVSQEKQGTVLDILSLGGLEYTASQSKLAWVAPYDRSSGWPGGFAWLQATQKRLADSQPLHALPFHYLEGFLLGYPDKAITGYLSPAGDHELNTVSATIPEVYRYVCGVPLFDVLAVDYADPGVVATEQNWNNFLQAVYDHPRMQPLLTSAEFNAARKERLLAHAKHVFPNATSYPRRSLEAVRLGLAQAPPQVPEDVNTAMERRLRTQTQSLLDKVKAASDPKDFCQNEEVTDEALARWALRGSLNPDDPARAVYTLVSSKWPKFYQDSLDAQLLSTHAEIPRDALTSGNALNYRSSIVTFLDLLSIPEFSQAFARLEAKPAQEVLEDIWRLRHLPPAERWVKAIDGGENNPLSQRIKSLSPWKWPPS